jgi:hypothetical protein
VPVGNLGPSKTEMTSDSQKTSGILGPDLKKIKKRKLLGAVVSSR